MSDLIGKLGQDLVEEKEGRVSEDYLKVPGITTQDQMNEVQHIQTNFGYHMSDLIGKLGRELVEEQEEKIGSSRDKTGLKDRIEIGM